MKNTYYEVVEAILNDSSIKRAVKYISPKSIIRATRSGTTEKGYNIEIVLTIGRPNFIEREFIKKCIKAKEPFPRIQLKVIKNK